MININIKRLTDSAKIPTYAHIGDAGADLYAAQEWYLKPNGIHAVPTGIAMEIPEGYVGYITPRSSMAIGGVAVMNAPGTIDSGYRGEIKVILVNHTPLRIHIKKGERIAQMVFHKFEEVFFEPVQELSDSERGLGGFGSSGR